MLSPFPYAGEMFLKRYENDKYETNVYSWGLALKRDKGSVVVKGVMKGSPADKSGIKVGDEVFAVNSLDVKQLSMIDLMALSLDDIIDRVELVYSGHSGRKMVVLKKEMLLPVVK
jgi:C-terminal processing protease CtpA/Prc